MKTCKYFAFLCVCILLGSQCTPKKEEQSAQMQTARFSDVKQTRTIPLSSLADNFKIVRIENSDSAIFKRWVIQVTDNYIGVRQHGGPFKLFDHSGKFLCDVGGVGNGPGEYGPIYDEQIDEANKKIYLMGFAYVKNLLEYDLNGRFIRAIPLTYDLKKPKFRAAADGSFGVVQMPFKDDKALAVRYAADGSIQQEVPAQDYMRVADFNGEIFSYRNTPAFDFMNTSIDTLFHYNVEKNIAEPVFTMNFPDPQDKPIHIYMELPGYYLTMVFGSGLVATDKSDGTSSYIKIVNDYFGNIEVPAFCFNNGWMVYNVEPMNLIETIEKRLAESDCSEKDKEQLNAVLSTLDENDNDLIFIAKLKQ